MSRFTTGRRSHGGGRVARSNDGSPWFGHHGAMASACRIMFERVFEYCLGYNATPGELAAASSWVAVVAGHWRVMISRAR